MPSPPQLRVLYVENGIGYGGAIICLRHLVRNLDRQHYRPMVVTGRTGPDYREIALEAEWRYVRDRYLDLVNLQRALAGSAWVARVPGLRPVLGQLLARTDDVVNFLPFFTRLLFITRAFRPALIHVNNDPLCNRAALLVGKLLGIPSVCHVRGDPRGSRMMGWLFGLPGQFIAVSRWISERIGEQGVPAERRCVIYDGIELDRLDLAADGRRWRARHGIADGDFAVGLVGLLIPWKGQRLFLAAIERLLRDIPRLRAVIVGGTPAECRAYEQELRTLAQRPELAGRVVFTGHCPSMAEAYNGLDVVVSASVQPEPLGTMIIECLTLGRPLVAPRHGGAVEMVEHERTGLLFEPGNAADLAAQIARFYHDPGLAERLGPAARAAALARFDIAAHVRAVEAVYRKLLPAVPPSETTR